MPRHFKIGETAVLVQAPQYPQYVGAHCTVEAPLRERCFTNPAGAIYVLACYLVRTPDGLVIGAPPQCLGKHFEPGDWDLLRDIWQPKRERRDVP